ncbi:hypothetical protein [Paraburkholderia heleia]|uniref:hypothetical protein n=1 Tax=Paraburkholderia heleia TaxID=634127 RepID=UPI002AB6A160|nr:hypothetical protein [Paraburkholderia heleia]
MPIFWTTPDQAFAPQARAVGIVIDAIGNISSAANPLVVGWVVGWLKDATHSDAAGLVYSAGLLVPGAMIVATLSIGRGSRSDREKEVEAVPRTAA